MTTKLIQLNAWYGKIGTALYRFLQKQDADILMLQEVHSSPEFDIEFFNFLQETQKRTGLPETFFSPRWEALFNTRKVYSGNAILSRTNLAERYAEFTHLEYMKDYERKTYDTQPMLFQHCVTEINGQKLNLVNYHGYCPPNGIKIGNEKTDQHCRQIAAYIAKLSGPVIFTGDLNLQPDSPSLAPLNALMRNLCLDPLVETTRNEFAYTMDTVDYIWVSKEINVKHFEVMPDLVSDHAPLLLDFDLI